MNGDGDVGARTLRSTPAILVGVVLALGMPALSMAVAVMWSWGAIEPDPDGALVQALQAVGLPALLLCPFGLIITVWAAGIRSILGWTASLVYGLPLLAVIWFVSVAWLGGLAGEPF
jgi:hypothetical protein